MSEALTPEQPSTTAQANQLLALVGEATTLLNNDPLDPGTTEKVPVDVPPLVARHFPELNEDQLAGPTTLTVYQNFDEDGKPQSSGTIANVKFTQREAGNHSRATHVNYHIDRDENGLSLERVIVDLGRNDLPADPTPEQRKEPPTREYIDDLLLAIDGLYANMVKAQDTERQLGLRDVSGPEAEEVIKSVAGLLPDTSTTPGTEPHVQ